MYSFNECFLSDMLSQNIRRLIVLEFMTLFYIQTLHTVPAINKLYALWQDILCTNKLQCLRMIECRIGLLSSIYLSLSSDPFNIRLLFGKTESRVF